MRDFCGWRYSVDGVAAYARMAALTPRRKRPAPLDGHPVSLRTMKEQGHPTTYETTITCTCGAVYPTISTVQNLRVGICAACHPFFTGEQRFIDTAGRVDKFAQRYGSTRARRSAPKVSEAAAS